MSKNLFKLCSLPLIAGAMLAFGTDNASAATHKGAFDPQNPFKYARKARPSKMVQTMEEFKNAPTGNKARKTADVKPTQTLKNHEAMSFLDGPDGDTWFYSSSLEADTIYHPYGGGLAGGWNEINITGFRFTIYDGSYNEIGTVNGAVTLNGDEAKVTSIELGSAVTQNFFNSDKNYEVMVYTVRNFEGYAGTNLNTDIYSIGGPKDENGKDKCIMTIPGYCVAAENIRQDRFTENFYVTFAEEYEPDIEEFTDPIEYANAYGMTLKTYKKGGFGLPTVINEHFVRSNCLPGDQESYPCLFTINGGKDKFGTYDVPMLVYVEYEKPYWVNPLGWNPDDPTSDEFDESPTPDNNLLVTAYKMETVTGSTVTEVATSRIPVVQREGYYATYYGIGGLDWTNDIVIDGLEGSDAKPAKYIVCTQDVLANSEDQLISFHIYDSEGEHTNTIAEDVDATLMLTDLPGKPRQALFAVLQDNNYYLTFVNIETGEETLALPAQYQGYSLTFNMDRVMRNGKTYYVFDTQHAINDSEFNALTQVVWLDEEGNVANVEEYNLGQDVAYAQAYMSGSVMSPYLFDYDDENELMFLIKRYEGLGSSTREEFCVVGANNGIMFQLYPDDDSKGILANISPVNLQTNPGIVVVWNKQETNVYTQETYPLPFVRFQGGDGSVENPYEITNASQLRLIGDEPAANYAIVKDLDGSDIVQYPIEGFKGTLDGRGHAVSNLSITPSTSSWAGLFNRAEGGVVSNLTFVNPSMDVTSQQSYAGIVAGEGFNLKVDNVHLYHPVITADAKFDGNTGAIVGKLTNGGSVTNCFVSGASIYAPGSEDGATGGIAGTLLTGASVKASTFTGNVEGGANVGGIAGHVDADTPVANCHVDADIVAQNTVGGVAGFSQRGLISNNFVEGTVKATKVDWWDEIISAGGVVGNLQGKFTSESDTETEPAAMAVTGNVVALSAITVPAGTEATAHRIVGKTSAELGAEDDEDAAFPENGLAGNYAYDTLAIFNDETGDSDTSAEGASKDQYEIDQEFLESIGYLFGSTETEPWRMLTLTPALYFETAISIVPSELTVNVGDQFNINVHILSRTEISEDELLGDFTGDWNWELFEMGNYTYSGNVLSIEFTALAEGESEFTIGLLGSTATCTVKATVPDSGAGIDNVAAANGASLSFNGNEVTCADAMIEIYSVSGLKAAAGYGTVSTSGLPAGIYVAVANGSTIKIAVK